MANRTLPTGTVTFLATDIEGSTRMVQDAGPATFREILERHHAILRAAIGRWGGTERGTEGDSFLVMFPEAPAALEAAAEAQRALAGTDWPEGARVRVRMGLHTGIGLLGGDDYVGVDVPVVARIAASAHGGQVLVSEATRGLVSAELPSGTTLRGLGEHKLRDIARPVQLFQLSIEGLPDDFPPPTTAGPVSVGNIPRRLTSFIGRDEELHELTGLLGGARLLTLTGPGGTGKSSLATELARRCAPDFPDGAWFIPLETVSEPGLVPAAIASELRLAPTPGRAVADQVVAYFSDRSALLLLDNVEQVLAVATYLRDLIARTTAVKLLVTSRAPLHLAAEQEYAVRPLALPDPEARDDGLLDNPSVQLFVERANRVVPGYRPQGPELDAIANICRRLDGLPLGIELAASRVGLLPASSIASRLAGQLDLPGSGARDLPDRQRSMQQAIAWSYDLLEEPVQRLLARLSVFRGGFRLEEAERVAGPEPDLGIDVLDGLSVLVDHSLVRPVRGVDGPRFELLETIRTFAAARLEASGESGDIGRRHALAYRDLAEAAAPHMPGNGQLVWLDRLEADHANLRSALTWAVERPDVETALRLGAALWRFWQLRGHVDEGRLEMTRVMALPTEGLEYWRMRACDAAGGLAWWGGDLQAADALYRSQLDLARTLEVSQGIADALFNNLHAQVALGVDFAELAPVVEEAAEHYRAAGDEHGLARLAYASETDGLWRRDDDMETELIAVLRRLEALDDEWWAAQVRSNLAIYAVDRGDVQGALRWTFSTINSARQMGDIPGSIILLRLVATVLLRADLTEEAAIVSGAYEALVTRHAVSVPPPAVRYLQVPTRDDFPMPDDAFEAAAARGAAMSLDEVLDFVVGVGRTPISASD